MLSYVREGADKSFARPGRKQATATKLGIYLTHSPRSSIHLLARCSNFGKPLKKFRILSAQPGLRGSIDLRVGRKMASFQLIFQFREQVMVWRGQIRRKGWVIKKLEAQVDQFLLRCKCLVSRGRTRPLWWISRGVFLSKCPSIAPAEISNTPRWQFGPLEDNQWGGCRLDPKKSRREIFQRIFALGIFWGEVSRYAAAPLIVALSPGHSDITRFRPWSPIALDKKLLDRTEKIPKVAQTTGTVDVFEHFGTHLAESFRLPKSSWKMEPTRSCEMPSCSAIDLAEIRRSSKISSWIWSIISGVVIVLRRPGRDASQVEKSTRLNWATQFLTVEYDGACSPNVSITMAWIFFGVLPCRKKKSWWQLASHCCWNRARHVTCLLSASVTRKDLQIGTWTDPSFQRHYRFRPTTLGIWWG